MARRLRKVLGVQRSSRQIMSGKNVEKSRARLGEMYFFLYDPKTKEEMRYYDIFPLVLPIEPAKGGFIGINFHYVEPILRAKILDEIASIDAENLSKKARLTRLITLNQKVASLKLVRPTLHRYLYSKMKSRFIVVDPSDWGLAIFLPVERFKKKRSRFVWEESSKMISEARTASSAQTRTTGPEN